MAQRKRLDRCIDVKLPSSDYADAWTVALDTTEPTGVSARPARAPYRPRRKLTLASRGLMLLQEVEE